MTNLVPIRRAIVSVSDKTDLVPFVRALVEAGAEIVSTGGTARALAEAGIDVIGIEKVTGFPEMMDGRVKTLHPAVHGALLGRRDDDDHVAAMRDHGITPIDLVCVNLYPFERTLREDLPREDAIELIDIGGPSMIRSAAKNHEFVTIVTSPSQYDRVASELQEHGGATTLDLRRDLAAAAFSRTAEYDATISGWMCGRQAGAFPPMLRISQTKKEQLRYGENPHQEAAVYADPADAGANVVTARLLHGKPLSYNNLNDGSAAFEFVRELRQVFRDKIGAAVIKHTNPCGAAVADSAADAFDRAYAGDPLAAFGGILALNAPVDRAAAERITDGQKFLEVVIAPSFDEDARAMLADRWKNVRLLQTGEIDPHMNVGPVEYRSIPGGMLVQHRDRAVANPPRWSHAAGPQPDQTLIESAAFCWMVAKHLKSNAVAIGADGRLLGAGAGQMDRVTAARLAVEKMNAHLRGGEAAEPPSPPGRGAGGEGAGLPSPPGRGAGGEGQATSGGLVAASDGFFPFPDGPELLIDAGVTLIIQPGGSKRDDETINLCEERGVTLLLTGVRHFRH